MEQAALEKRLSKRIFMRRLAEGVISVLFLVAFFISYHWWTISKNDVLAYILSLSLSLAIVSAYLLLLDFLYCRYRTIEKASHNITVYRGMLTAVVYIDGLETGCIGPLSYINVVENWVSADLSATICFSRVFWYIAHISFSDHTSVDV